MPTAQDMGFCVDYQFIDMNNDKGIYKHVHILTCKQGYSPQFESDEEDDVAMRKALDARPPHDI